jgi:hypothetical protein
MSNERDKQLAQGVVREWSEHDMNEHYNGDYLREEFGSDHLEDRIVAALTTVRQEVERKVWERAIGLVRMRLTALQAQTATLDGLSGAACTGRDMAIEEIVQKLEAASKEDKGND